jgi:hypothetical protein
MATSHHDHRTRHQRQQHHCDRLVVIASIQAAFIANTTANMADSGENTKQTGPPRPSRFTTGAVRSGHPQGNPQPYTQAKSYTYSEADLRYPLDFAGIQSTAPESTTMGSTILPTSAPPTGTPSYHQESAPTPNMVTQAIQPTAHVEPVVVATPSRTHNAPGTQPSTASSRRTRGGSTIRSAAKKSGQSLDQIYPDLFKPTNRATFKDLLSETENIRVFYPWVAANPPSATDMTRMKNKVDYRVRQVFFVFCSTKPLGRIVADACPDISNTSMTFSDLYGYAQRMSANFKHRLLYQQMYGLARTWLDDFGKTDFRLDPRIHIDSWHADDTGLLCGGTSTCAAGPGMCVNGGK